MRLRTMRVGSSCPFWRDITVLDQELAALTWKVASVMLNGRVGDRSLKLSPKCQTWSFYWDLVDIAQYFFICYMRLGQFLELFNICPCLFIILTSYGCFTGDLLLTFQMLSSHSGLLLILFVMVHLKALLDSEQKCLPWFSSVTFS